MPQEKHSAFKISNYYVYLELHYNKHGDGRSSQTWLHINTIISVYFHSYRLLDGKASTCLTDSGSYFTQHL